jgi:hypothetical protein
VSLGVTTYLRSHRAFWVSPIEGKAIAFVAQTKQPVACRVCYTEA